MRSPILSLGDVSGLGFAPIENPPTTSKCLSSKVLLNLPPFGRNSSVLLWPPIRPPIWGLGWTWGGSKMVPIEMLFPHFYSTSIRTIGLSCTIWPQTVQHRQINAADSRAMAMGRPCNSIGGLMINVRSYRRHFALVRAEFLVRPLRRQYILTLMLIQQINPISCRKKFLDAPS